MPLAGRRTWIIAALFCTGEAQELALPATGSLFAGTSSVAGTQDDAGSKLWKKAAVNNIRRRNDECSFLQLFRAGRDVPNQMRKRRCCRGNRKTCCWWNNCFCLNTTVAGATTHGADRSDRGPTSNDPRAKILITSQMRSTEFLKPKIISKNWKHSHRCMH